MLGGPGKLSFYDNRLHLCMTVIASHVRYTWQSTTHVRCKIFLFSNMAFDFFNLLLQSENLYWIFARLYHSLKIMYLYSVYIGW